MAASSCPILSQDHNRRQRSQGDNGMIAGQCEVRTDNKASPPSLSEAMVPFFVVAKRVAASTDAKAQVAGQTERPPSRQQEAVSRLQLHRVGNIIYR
jgi:hypothetical protein